MLSLVEHEKGFITLGPDYICHVTAFVIMSFLTVYFYR